MNHWWPTLVFLVAVGMAIWAWWLISTGSSTAPWDDDEEEDGK